MSYPFISLLRVFFNLPGLKGQFSLPLIILGIFQAVVFSLLAGWQGSKKVLALKPAEALRPPTPIGGRRIFLEEMRIIWNRLNVQGMMAVRNLSRNKGRSLFIFFGIMFSFAISGFTWSMNDMLQRLTLDQYEKVEVYDVKLGFANPLNEKKVHRELSGFSGVSRTEPMAEVPVTLKNQWKKKNAVVLGLSETSRLYNILDDDYNKTIPPKRGLLLSERLAKLLDAEVGTRLYVESPMKANGKAGVLEVVEITPQYAGTNAYMELGALQEFLGQKDLVTSCMLSVNKEGIAILRDKYMYADTINTIDERSQKLNKFKEMMASYGSMIYIYSLIGIIIGFAIIYNSSVITLSERSRELASMMVLGMTPREVLSVVTFEQWCVAIPAMLVGVPMSRAMMSGISSAMSTDVYTMPEKITPFALFMALVVTTISIWIAQKTAARKIRNLSLVEVLKSGD